VSFTSLIFGRKVLVTIVSVSASGTNRSSSNVSTVAIEETPPLNVKDFPAIKFWYKNQHCKENGRRRNAQQNNIGRSSGHASQDENLAFWFLQNVDGTIVDSDIVTSLRAEAKLIWSGMLWLVGRSVRRARDGVILKSTTNKGGLP
jgi:hypothetical protein